MKTLHLYALPFALALTIGTAGAQQTTTTPSPAPEASPVTTAAPATGEPSATTAPATTSPDASAPAQKQTTAPKPKMKKIAKGNLNQATILYAVTHPTVAIGKLRSIHTVDFSKLRVQQATPSALMHVHADASVVAYEPVLASDMVAQSNPLGTLLNIIANINVQDALNGSLNGNTTTVSLSNLLNNNKIAIGQVVGVYVGGGGIITTIIK